MTTTPSAQRSLRVAVIGCSHGTLDDIYASVQRCDDEAKQRNQPEVDLVICCGDFQAMRNTADLETMACPRKYRELGQFHGYYSGEKRAPKLTVVIGGNHESSGYMWELFHGGWLAPNIYFLGFAGSVLVDGWLRISGASGIWKGGDWKKGHYETVPFDDRTIRSVYHIREYDVARLLQLKNRPNAPIDIFLSHDWPLGIEQHGDTGALIHEKPFFREEINSNTLGSPPLHALLTTLQPRYWFSAHLHVKFAALYHHDGRGTSVKRRVGPRPAQRQQQQQQAPKEVMMENPDEIVLDDDEEEGGGQGGADGPKSEEKGCPGGCSGADEGHAHAPSGAQDNPDAIDLEDDDEEDEEEEAKEVEAMLVDSPRASVAPQAVAPEQSAPAAETGEAAVEPPAEEKEEEVDYSRSTRFLALSKPGRGKDFLQVLDIPSTSASRPPAAPSAAPPADAADASSSSDARPPPTLFYDPHWLAILRATAPFLSLEQRALPFPPLAELQAQIEADYAWVCENVGEGEGMVEVGKVQEFVRTAPTQGEWETQGRPPMPSWYTNPQTLSLTSLLQIENKINPIPAEYLAALEAQKAQQAQDAAQAAEEKKRLLAEAKRAALAELDGDGGEGAEGGAVVESVELSEQADEEPRGEHPRQVREKERIAEEHLHAAEAAAAAGGNPEEIAIEDDDE
ncbi:hypothetical protein JCM10207_001842 [Rhodosporidiobolus poonsookiae]